MIEKLSLVWRNPHIFRTWVSLVVLNIKIALIFSIILMAQKIKTCTLWSNE